MKIRTFITSVVAGVSLFAFAGVAAAATTYTTGTGTPTVPNRDVNVYGASAQFSFWKREFPNYLASAGCTTAGLVSGTSADKNHFIVQADCSAVGGPSLVTFRASSKASYDGPLAVDGNTTNTNRDGSCDSFGGANYRPMIDASMCSGGTCSNPTASATSCKQVTIGASDVLVSDFQQISKGVLKGPAGGSATTRDFKVNPVSVSMIPYCRPLAIPFAFFINKTVATIDSGGTTTTTLTNISSAEAKMIFSGSIKNWADLQAANMESKPLSICLRHAGSGTHASLDAFMRPMTMPTNQVIVGTSRIYFNDSTGDMMNCLNGTGAWTGNGAIGYADADRDISTLANVVRIQLDGKDPITANVDDYSWPFATVQNMYIAGTADNLLNDICTYAGQPSLVHFNNAYWSATCDMKHTKNSNFSNFISNLPANGGTYHNANCN